MSEKVKGIYRLELDVIVVADNLDAALESLRFKGRGFHGRLARPQLQASADALLPR